VKKKLKRLERLIGCRFRHKSLLVLALTHPSYRHEQADLDEDNQRLEFLGDAVLGLLAAHWLYANVAEFDEGDMTRVRSRVTSTDALAEIAASFDLGSFLLLGKGEQMSGGQDRKSTLADAMEAVVGAAYLDGGLKSVSRVFTTLFLPAVNSCLEAGLDPNPKGHLQQILQRERHCQPEYRVIKTTGPAHEKTFRVEVRAGKEVLGKGSGASRKDAEKEAAQAALRRLV
jgi:ribonuclease III